MSQNDKLLMQALHFYIALLYYSTQFDRIIRIRQNLR